MKIIEKITLILYSNIILIMSVILCLLVFGWLDANVVANLAKALLIGEKSSGIILGVSVVFILLSIRCIFFDPTSKQEQKDKQGVLLANDNGKLMISKETIENLVEAVTKEYKEAKDVSSRVELDKNNNVNIYVNLVVGSETIIKDLTVDLQNRIKEKVKQSADLEVKEVNITIKKAVQEKQRKIEQGNKKMEDIKNFLSKYKGAIIGVIVAIIILATRLYEVIVGILLILAGAFVGNYIQQNKDEVKDKTKKFIDKM